MQPKLGKGKKQDLMEKMISADLSTVEKEKYMCMLTSLSDLFITSHEEIRGFQGEDLHIQLKEGVKPMRQRLRRMSQEQMIALKEEVDKLLKAGFICSVKTAEWVSPVVVTPKKDG